MTGLEKSQGHSKLFDSRQRGQYRLLRVVVNLARHQVKTRRMSLQVGRRTLYLEAVAWRYSGRQQCENRFS